VNRNVSGVGRICFKGEKPQALNPGDTVNIPPDTMHWHGASPDRLFSHLALSEAGEQGQGTAWGTYISKKGSFINDLQVISLTSEQGIFCCLTGN
jgi:hypothetical protein